MAVVSVSTKPCPKCKKTSIVEITLEEMNALASGEHVQNALAGRDASFREMFVSGYHPDCWDETFGAFEEEDEEEEEE